MTPIATTPDVILEAIARGICCAMHGLPDRMSEDEPEWREFITEARYAVSYLGKCCLTEPIMAISVMTRCGAYYLRVRHRDETWQDIAPGLGILAVKGDC